MGTRLYVNNFSTTLSAAITSTSQTSITIASAGGLSTLTGGNYYVLTIDDGTNIEVVQVTAVSGTTLTIVRTYEAINGASTPHTFASGTTIEMRDTAGGIASKLDTATSATANTVLKSISGSWQASTETYAAPGASGNVMTSDGTNWTSAAPAGGGGLTRSVVTASLTAAVDTEYIANSGSAYVVFTLPATAAAGKVIGIRGWGAGSWKVTANTGQTIQFGSQVTASGGTITAASQYDCIYLVCTVSNTNWLVVNAVSQGLSLNGTNVNSLNIPLIGSTGSGAFVGATSPTLVTPILGTPTSGTLSNCSGLKYVGSGRTIFNAYLSANQSISTATSTKILFDATVFDPSGLFSVSTHRYTPNVAGYYYFYTNFIFNSGTWSGAINQVSIYKNGGTILDKVSYPPSSGYGVGSAEIITQMNGTTDYIEIYIYQNSGATQTLPLGNSNTFFCGELLEAT